MKKTFITLLALAGIACGETTVLTFDGVVDPNNQNASVKVEHDFDTDEWNIRGVGNGPNNTWSGTQTLTDGTVAGLSLNSNGGKFWDYTTREAWSNTSALSSMNAELGTTMTADDITSIQIMGSAAQGNKSTLTLNFTNNALYQSGSEVVFYLLVGTYSHEKDANENPKGAAYENFSVEGLEKGYNVQWAKVDGTGFTTENLSVPVATHALIRVSGTLTEAQSVSFSADAARNGWSMVAYAPAVPEPATATLSLLALAGLAARRRRA